MARDIAQEIIDNIKKGAPDYVVTALMQEREDKIQGQGLGGKVPTTSNIVSYAKSLLGGGSSKDDSGLKTVPIVQEKAQGVVELKPDALFNPNEFLQGGNATYGTSYGSVSSGGSEGLNKIMGYVIVGLVGIALLDRFMNSSKK